MTSTETRYYYTGPSYGVFVASDGRFLFIGRDYVRRGSAGYYPAIPDVAPVLTTSDLFDQWWALST